MDIKRIYSNDRHLVVDLFDQYRIFYKQSSNPQIADAFIKARLDNNESIIFIATEQRDGREIPVGFTQLYPTYSSVKATKNWILNDLYVDADHRKKGIGEKLIKAAMDFAKDNNARFVQLETAIDNYTAQSLYDSIGFTRQSPEEGYYIYRIDLV